MLRVRDGRRSIRPGQIMLRFRAVLIAGAVAVGFGVTATAALATPPIFHAKTACKQAMAGCGDLIRGVVRGTATDFGMYIYRHDGAQACSYLTSASQALIIKEAHDKFGDARPQDDTCAQAIIAYYPVLTPGGGVDGYNRWLYVVRPSALNSPMENGGYVHWSNGNDGPYREQRLVVDDAGDHFLINLAQSQFPSTA
jgi:hypothetical protein